MIQINDKAPEFTTKAFHDDDIKDMSLADFHGKWVILFFYPGDFTFVCPTEISELADHYDEFKKMNVQVLSVSTDSVHVHKAWKDASDTIKKVKFPMLSDMNGRISRAYGTYIEDEGQSLRGTFIIDPEGQLKALEIHDNDIGRSVTELMRKVQAAQFVREHHGQVCPASWKPGAKTLKPGLDLVGKI
jgi:NADH-dependent peroxiredoxin subunit C